MDWSVKPVRSRTVPAAIAQQRLDFRRPNLTGAELEREHAGAASMLAGRS